MTGHCNARQINKPLFFFVVLMLSYVTCGLPYLEPEFLPSASNVTYISGDLAILVCAVKHLGTKFVSIILCIIVC